MINEREVKYMRTRLVEQLKDLEEEKNKLSNKQDIYLGRMIEITSAIRILNIVLDSGDILNYDL